MRALARALLLALAAAGHSDEFHVGAGAGEPSQPTPVKDGNYGAHSPNDKARIRRRASDDATYAGRSRKRAHENGGARSCIT